MSMGIPQFIDKLDESQLYSAKEMIEDRLNKFKEAEKLKFACLIYGGMNHCWVDVRDEKGWKLLKEKYVNAAEEEFLSTVNCCYGVYTTKHFRVELPRIEIEEVSALEYASWLEDSLNPSFIAEENK